MAFLHGVTLAHSLAHARHSALRAYRLSDDVCDHHTEAITALANRVTFKAYMVFLTLGLLFVYFPFVHMIWGGTSQRWGVLDFAGGIVVHNTAGMAALASILYVGAGDRCRAP